MFKASPLPCAAPGAALTRHVDQLVHAVLRLPVAEVPVRHDLHVLRGDQTTGEQRGLRQHTAGVQGCVLLIMSCRWRRRVTKQHSVPLRLLHPSAEDDGFLGSQLCCGARSGGRDLERLLKLSKVPR